jgi:very-short-patch-repair endonuclease/flagellar biosynthesis GTPase FlhF
LPTFAPLGRNWESISTREGMLQLRHAFFIWGPRIYAGLKNTIYGHELACFLRIIVIIQRYFRNYCRMNKKDDQRVQCDSPGGINVIQNTNIQKKLEMARHELLDLGLRNPLLNYRTLKARGLEIIREKSEQIYKILVVDKKKMSFHEALKGSDTKQLTLDTVAIEANEEDTVSQANYVDMKLQTNYPEKQLEQRLLNTYYSARTYIEEQGVNILYIAFGMLHWYEADSSQEARKSPLILVPVQLERVSAKERFTLSYTEDEIGHNISLIAKMKAEFGLGIPELLDSDQINLGNYFDFVTQSIEGQKRWFIDRDSIVIGFFSFGKFLMYRDLDVNNWPEHFRPEQHPIITALLEDGFREPASQIGENDHIDQHFKFHEANHIMDADSSQIIAILDANQGRNMVIQGPPGTGKSQTITNLIAEAIAAGKKVLFVSEKMAALEVVKRRLDAVGLGVACLELHSHKTNKKSLLNDLASTLDLGKPKYNNTANIDLLEEMRNRLNEYSVAMNSEVGHSGVTPYQAMGEMVGYQVQLKNVELPIVTIDSMQDWTSVVFLKREALVNELQNVLRSLGVPAKHPFWGSRKKVVLPAELDSIKKACSQTNNISRKISDALQTYTKEVNFPSVKDLKNTQTFLQFLNKAINSPDLKEIRLQSDIWLKKRNELQKLAEAGQEYAGIHEQYDSLLIPESWDQDLIVTRQAIVSYQDKWWKFLSGDYRKAKNLVLALRKNPKDKALPLLGTIDSIMEARRLKNTIEQNNSSAIELFPNLWSGVNSQWDYLSVVIEWVSALHADIDKGQVPVWIVDFLTHIPDKKRLADIVLDTESLIADSRRSIHHLESQLEFDGKLRFGTDEGLIDRDYSSMIHITDTWYQRISELHEMASYNNLTAVCEAEELQPYTSLSEEWEQAAEFLAECYRWNWYTSIVSKAFMERPALSNFDGSRHNHTVQKFKELDQSFTELNRFRLAEEHWKKLPKYEAGGQLGVLRREFEKKTRHLPIRQLISKAGHAIQAIKPVFMMGPLSISAYIEPGNLEFDLVVFDEASQVKPVDAFGAIIRAKQAIVVGDSKQMPPTNFFDSIAKEDEEQEEENFVADMESILGLFVGQNAPQRMLRWHYRSRHESLIAVSNHEFYDDKLVVFPSPDSDKKHSGLQYNYLSESHYDRGKSRTNKLEAKAVAQAVVEHAHNRPHLTLGVAAFSKAQMQAIMDELEVLRRSDSSSESFFSAHPFEPFFVKNLENVQGDERDVIFISIGYGKTSEGYLAMEFGPLNREGGERRLNVLITRARLRCEVFTNLKSDDIDLNRSDARGVKALKTFLKYAESGILDIPIVTGKDFDSAFEEAVCKSLKELGFNVKQQVGSGGFFVDLAVVDSDSPGRYLLGIECDGATYHSARSARDRDRLRQAVLEGLGWTIHRIWSTDWFKQPERELKRVVEAINKAKIFSKTEPVNRDNNEVLEMQRDESSQNEQVAEALLYQTATLSINLGEREFHTLPLTLVASWVSQVVKVESPVHISEVMKRICDAAGIKRVGSRIQETIERSFGILSDVRKKGDFLWMKEMEVPLVRYRSDLNINKKVHLIPLEEIALAVIKIVKDSFGADEDTIASSAFQTLGFARVTEDMRGLILPIIDSLVTNKILVNKGKVFVLA